jgi:hypothetical protein
VTINQRTSFLLLAVIFLSSCSSGPGLVYEQDGSERLKNGTVRLETRWTTSDEAPDTRTITVVDGTMMAESVTASRGGWRGLVPLEEWKSLWKKLEPALTDTDLGVAPMAANGRGPYHIVELTLGNQQRRFSSQLRRNIFGVFSTSDVSEGLQYTDAIAECVGRFANTQVAQPKHAESPK